VFPGPRIDQISVEHVELSGRVGPDLHRHTYAGALVVSYPGGDVRKVVSALPRCSSIISRFPPKLP
jgi:hypothetical protein